MASVPIYSSPFNLGRRLAPPHSFPQYLPIFPAYDQGPYFQGCRRIGFCDGRALTLGRSSLALALGRGSLALPLGKHLLGDLERGCQIGLGLALGKLGLLEQEQVFIMYPLGLVQYFASRLHNHLIL